MSDMRRRRVAGERTRARRSQPDPATGDQAGTAPAGPGAETEPPTPGAPVGRSNAQAPEQRLDDGRRGWPFAVAAVLAAVLLVGVVVSGVLGYRLVQADPTNPPDPLSSSRSDALAAARAHAQEILSYDHRTLDADFARAGKALTGTFKKEYTRTTDTVVRPSAAQYKVVVKAEVVAASVVRASADRAVVLLYVDQTTTSNRLEGPKVDLNRVRMTLVEADGNWLVSELDAL